jgi:RNA polymerase sigma factor (sigma-70 family)
MDPPPQRTIALSCGCRDLKVKDDVWLAEIFDAHAIEVRRYLRRRLTGEASPDIDADDLTAEVFAITWRRREDVTDPILAWLYGVARRVLATHRRRVIALPTVDVEEDRHVIDTADLVSDDLAMKRAWSILSARDREVLLLLAWEGLSEIQVAAVLGLSEGGASAAISRARRRLRDAIAAQGTAADG